jgi:signal transduction histidine kinase
MSTQDLDQLIFSFCDDNNKLLSKIRNTLNKIIFMNDQSSTFKQFKVKKMPLDDDSFILCFVDYSVQVLADKSIQGENELVSLINASISHEMRNPLNIITNQTEIISILCQGLND